MAAPLQGLRARVERMLRGDIRADDFGRLFLYARERSDGSEAVQEIGNFVAHHNKRTRGITTQRGQDFFVYLAFRLRNRTLDFKRLPPDFPKFLEAAVRHMTHKVLKEKTGFSLKEATKAVPNIKAHLTLNLADGTLEFKGTAEELVMARGLSEFLIVGPAFTAADLCRDLHAILRKNNLLLQAEEKHLKTLYPDISMFALSALHNSVAIIVDASSEAPLSLGVSPRGTLGIFFVAPSTRPGETRLTFEVFSTDLRPENHCEAEIQNPANAEGHDIEINPARRLQIVK